MRFEQLCDWKQYKLKEISKIYDGTHQTPDYKDHGISFVSVEDIDDLYATTKFITKEAFVKDFKVYPKKNDILMTRIGDIGTPALVTKDKPLAYYVSLALIKPTNNIDSTFAKYMIQSDYFQHELWKRTIHVAFPKKINKEEIGECLCFVPNKTTQQRIGRFLLLIDQRIETQNKIIEKYESLIKQINNNLFRREDNSKIGDFIQEISKRNKDGTITNVLSVSNKNGFVKQSEQFEEKELASEDKTHYKIVQKGDFAFNPARINVGSIALLKNQEIGIVSPMYICFKPKNIPDYILESYFLSSSFKKQMNKRLEGSVRMCLTIDGMRNIRFHNLDKKELEILNILLKLRNFIFLNKKILNLYCLQKNYLLSNLFI